MKTARRIAFLLLMLAISMATAIGSPQPEEQYNRLMAQMNHYYQEQQFEKALSAVKEAASLAEEAFGEDHTLTTTAFYTLAQLYQSLGMLKEARVQYLKVLTLYNQSFDVGDLDKAIVREGLGAVYLAGGEYEKAEEQYQQVLEKKKELLGVEDPEISYTQASLAELYRRMGRYRKAGPLFEKVIARMTDQLGTGSPALYSVLANQAKLFEDIGKYERAEKIYLQVWSFDRKTLGDSHPNTIIDRNNLAGIYRKRGRYRQAEDVLIDVMENAATVFGDQHPETITAMNNLALLYENIGLYDKAQPLFSDAMRLAETSLGKSHPKTINIMNNLALLFESQGLFEQAEPLYLRVLFHSSDVKGVEHPETVGARNNLAFLYMLQQKYARAEKQFRLVTDVWEKQLGERHQYTLKAMNNLGRALHKQGRYEQAEPLFNRALQLRRETLGPGHADAIRSMIDMGRMYRDVKRLKEAEATLKEALTLAEANLGDKHPYTFEALNSLADVYELKKAFDEAIQLRKNGFERRSEFLDRVLWTTGENTRQGYIRIHKPEQDRLLRLLAQANRPETARLALCVSLQRKGLLLKIASEIQKIVQISSTPELKALARDLQTLQKELAAKTLSGPAGQTADGFQRQLLALEKKRNDLQSKLGAASVAFRNVYQRVEVKDVLSRLGHEFALVEFLTYTDKRGEVLAVVATNDPQQGSRVHLVPLGKLLIMKQAISEYRSMIQEEDTEEEDLRDAGMALYEQIWKPLTPYLKGRRSVYVVPDSILHLLPFDTLIDENDQYLVESMDLRILSTARELVAEKLPAAERDIMIFAGPDYDVDTIKDQKKEILGRRGAVSNGIRLASVGLRSLSFDKLTGAEKEGAAIKKVSDRQQIRSIIYAKRQAEERQLRTIRKPPRIVHIATHGFFLKPEDSMIRRLLSLQRGARNRLPPPGDNPLLRAGLAFAGINTNAPFLGDIDTNNDGILTALEVLKLNLIGTELVVLSACETGVGEIHAGEGVYGLRRAFQEAGVTSVLNSLWPVSDEGTRELMVGFYREYLSGKTTREALKASQLTMLKGEWNHPYYWAAFVVVGGK